MLVEAFLVRVKAVDAALQLGGRGAPLKLELAAVHHRPQQREGFGTNVLAPVTKTTHKVRQKPANKKKGQFEITHFVGYVVRRVK